MKSFIYALLSIIALFLILPVEQLYGSIYAMIPLTFVFIFFYLTLTTN